MWAFRIIVAVLLAACAVPIVVLGVAWRLAAAAGCALQFETAHTCALGGTDIGWLLDTLLMFGVWGALSFGLGVYIFAVWVIVELAAIVLGALRSG
jgi:hypothetical protein